MLSGDVHLGFTVGGAEPVAVPRKHLAITGQTQEAGKTTALEALIGRAGVRAVTFITKRGEGAFASARPIRPYFREQADWQFVASILEASRGEKLKFERAWIIRASRGALTLAGVQRNVKKALETAKGLSADVYLTLDAYLDVVVPQIGRVTWAHTLDLEDGINAMDLTEFSIEMQHLVIKSALDYVLKHHTSTVVVVPEAWKFIPQGRGTPVKLAAESFVRQAAALGNYLWLDSQDLGGVDKTILRSVALWILGVQREANEIARTLANIPAVVAKPKASDLALLELGQFYVCWGKHAIKTYVQPTWMTDAIARDVAAGRIEARLGAQLAMARNVGTAYRAMRDGLGREYKEDAVTKAEATRLTADNAQLREEIADLRRQLSAAMEKPADDRRPPPPAARERAEPRRPVERFDAEHEQLYQQFKARLMVEAATDPHVLAIVEQRPEIRVLVERQVLTADGASTRGRIARLIAEAYFEQARTSTDVLNELQRRGRRPTNIELGNEMKALTEMGFFTRDNKWYVLVPNMKVQVQER